MMKKLIKAKAKGLKKSLEKFAIKIESGGA